MKVAVIGRGVSGLTSGVLLAEEGLDVTILSKEETKDTNSMAAGAYWFPYGVGPIDRVTGWAKKSYDIFRGLASFGSNGVSMKTQYRFYSAAPNESWILDMLDKWEEVVPREFPLPLDQAYSFSSPTAEVPVYMEYLSKRFSDRGGETIIREVNSFDEVLSEYDVVVNCSGLGAKALAKDEKVYPSCGQVIRLEKPKDFKDFIQVYHHKNEFAMILPRSNDVILGGSAEDNEWSRETKPAVAERILKSCTILQPKLKELKVLGHNVGLRPCRDAVRLELEKTPNNKAIVHNYGHGGAGYTLSWGCAEEVVQLVSGVTK